MNSSWSPPEFLKSGGSHRRRERLKKDGSAEITDTQSFAQWWRDSLTAWSNAGVNSYYVNMQNEPDFETTDWDTCRFDPTENTSIAGYKQAFTALYTNLNSMPNRPKLLVAEGASIPVTTACIDVLDATDKSNAYGWSHHLYNGSADVPDAFINQMDNFRTNYGDKPSMQTEFAKGDSVLLTWTDAMNLAKLIYNSLTVENAAVYLYWELFWPSPNGLVSVSTTSYSINPVYYAMKHYSKFTDPNWQRVETNTSSSNLRISAFIDPNNQQLSVIIINTASAADINLNLAFTGFSIVSGSIWRSSPSQNCVLIGSFNPADTLTVPANSITTLALSSNMYENCAAVQAGGHRLLSDLNGDCYVNYEDMAIMAWYWLNSECTQHDNCEGADFEPADGIVDFFDFGDFALQWRQCNNPLDANCTPNW